MFSSSLLFPVLSDCVSGPKTSIQYRSHLPPKCIWSHSQHNCFVMLFVWQFRIIRNKCISVYFWGFDHFKNVEGGGGSQTRDLHFEGHTCFPVLHKRVVPAVFGCINFPSNCPSVPFGFVRSTLSAIPQYGCGLSCCNYTVLSSEASS